MFDVLEPPASRARSGPSRQIKFQTSYTTKETIYLVPPNAQESRNRARLLIFEDKEAGTKMIVKGDKWDELMVLIGIVPESCHSSPFSVVATLVLRAQQMAKRSHPFTDESWKYTGTSAKSKPEGK